MDEFEKYGQERYDDEEDEYESEDEDEQDGGIRRRRAKKKQTQTIFEVKKRSVNSEAVQYISVCSVLIVI